MSPATLEAGIAVGLRDVPRVPRLGRAPRHRHQLRRLPRPHRAAALGDGRRRVRARGHRRRARAGCRPSCARRWPRARPGSRPARRRRTGRRRTAGAVPARRHARARGLITPLRRARPGRRRAAARASGSSTRRLRAAADASAGRSRGPRCSRSRAIRGTRTWPSCTTRQRCDAAATSGRRSRPSARVPDEHGRAVHVQHGAQFRGAHGHAVDERLAAYRDPEWRASGPGRAGTSAGSSEPTGRSSRSSEREHPELSAAGRRLAADAASTRSTPCSTSRAENLETALPQRARQRRPRTRSAMAAPAGRLLIGLSDSGAHVSQLCDALHARPTCSATGYASSEVLPLEQAVHKLTGEPAACSAFEDRGCSARA